MSETRKLVAILVADVVGYSRLAGADEDRTLSRLRGLRSDLIDPAIAAHHGRIVKRTGDGSIIEFRSVVDAVRCALEVQNGLIERNAGLPPERRIEFRVGIHLGDVVEEADSDLMRAASTSRRVLKAARSLERYIYRRTPMAGKPTADQAVAAYSNDVSGLDDRRRPEFIQQVGRQVTIQRGTPAIAGMAGGSSRQA
jgi:hypothetical protein